MQFCHVNKRMVAGMLVFLLFISAFSMLGIQFCFVNNSITVQNMFPQFSIGLSLLSYTFNTFEVEEENNNNTYNEKQQKVLRQYNSQIKLNVSKFIFYHNLQSAGNSKMVYYFITPIILETSDIANRIICFMHEKDGKKGQSNLTIK